jgi:hypothetical protein
MQGCALDQSSHFILTAGTQGEGHFEAQQRALADAYEYLTKSCNLTSDEAFAYCCAKVDARFGGPANVLVLLAVPDPSAYLEM